MQTSAKQLISPHSVTFSRNIGINISSNMFGRWKVKSLYIEALRPWTIIHISLKKIFAICSEPLFCSQNNSQTTGRHITTLAEVINVDCCNHVVKTLTEDNGTELSHIKTPTAYLLRRICTCTPDVLYQRTCSIRRCQSACYCQSRSDRSG